jgi:hypothetical protein
MTPRVFVVVSLFFYFLFWLKQLEGQSKAGIWREFRSSVSDWLNF